MLSKNTVESTKRKPKVAMPSCMTFKNTYSMMLWRKFTYALCHKNCFKKSAARRRIHYTEQKKQVFYVLIPTQHSGMWSIRVLHMTTLLHLIVTPINPRNDVNTSLVFTLNEKLFPSAITLGKTTWSVINKLRTKE